MQQAPILTVKILPAGTGGSKHAQILKVEGGLRYIKGNALLYFSLTYTQHRQGFPEQDYSGGCNPELILEHWPKFADLAALHLSGLDGAPMHAEANARYFAEKGKQDTLQKHLRCADNSADHLLVLARAGDWAQFDADVNAMRPRWKQEALACIAKHGLVLYGDAWTGEYPAGLRHASEVSAPITFERTYIDAWRITSTAASVDANPNMESAGADMDHWRVVLRRGKARMTVYFSKGRGHNGAEPSAQEVINCIAQDASALDQDFADWAGDLGYDIDSRKVHRTYTICRRQAERLRKFLGEEHYTELMGGE
jgi:hypothetical protein